MAGRRHNDTAGRPGADVSLVLAYAQPGRVDEAKSMLAKADQLMPVKRSQAQMASKPGLAAYNERRRVIFRNLGAEV